MGALHCITKQVDQFGLRRNSGEEGFGAEISSAKTIVRTHKGFAHPDDGAIANTL
jgi:hypothetical protein